MNYHEEHPHDRETEDKFAKVLDPHLRVFLNGFEVSHVEGHALVIADIAVRRVANETGLETIRAFSLYEHSKNHGLVVFIRPSPRKTYFNQENFRKLAVLGFVLNRRIQEPYYHYRRLSPMKGLEQDALALLGEQSLGFVDDIPVPNFFQDENSDKNVLPLQRNAVEERKPIFQPKVIFQRNLSISQTGMSEDVDLPFDTRKEVKIIAIDGIDEDVLRTASTWDIQRTKKFLSDTDPRDYMTDLPPFIINMVLYILVANDKRIEEFTSSGVEVDTALLQRSLRLCLTYMDKYPALGNISSLFQAIQKRVNNPTDSLKQK